MNKKERKRLQEIKDQIIDLISEIREFGENEREKYDNAPENLQNTDRYNLMYEYSDTIEEVCNELENQMEELQGNVIDNY